jgi:hypothetical protein
VYFTPTLFRFSTSSALRISNSLLSTTASLAKRLMSSSSLMFSNPDFRLPSNSAWGELEADTVGSVGRFGDDATTEKLRPCVLDGDVLLDPGVEAVRTWGRLEDDATRDD